MLLQIGEKPVTDALGAKLDLLKNSKGQIRNFVKMGIFGDNKVFRAAEYRGYADCLRQLGKEGLKGLYKGALTGVILSVLNTNLRTVLYEEAIQQTKQQELWTKNIYSKPIYSRSCLDLFPGRFSHAAHHAVPEPPGFPEQH